MIKNKLIHKICIALLIAALPVRTNAQQEFNSLSEVWNFAIFNNQDVNIYQLKINQAIQDNVTARSFLYPKINANFNGQNNLEISPTPVPGELMGKPGQTVYLQFGKNYTYNAGLSFSKSILDWQSIFQSRIAKINVELKNAEKSYFIQNLKEQLAQLYFSILIAQKSVEIAESDLAVADSLVMLANQRFSQYLTDELVLNQLKINRNGIFERLEQNKAFLQQNKLNLKILLGLKTGDEIILKENVLENKKLTLDVIITQNQNYLELSRLQTEISNKEFQKSKARFAPSITMNAYFGNTQFQDNFKMSFNSKDWNSSKYIGIAVSLPLFSGFANSSQYKSASIKKNIDLENYRNNIRKSAINDSILQTNLISSYNIVSTSSSTYSFAKKNEQLARQKYTEGIINLDEYLKYQENYLNIENQYLSNLAQYFINKSIIESHK